MAQLLVLAAVMQGGGDRASEPLQVAVGGEAATSTTAEPSGHVHECSGPGELVDGRYECAIHGGSLVSAWPLDAVASDAQAQVAESFADTTERLAQRFADPAQARDAGYTFDVHEARVDAAAGTDVESDIAAMPMQGMANHLINPEYANDGIVIDSSKPDALVYAQSNSRAVLIGVMFIAPPGVRGSQIGGPLTTWHTHPGDGACLVGSAPVAFAAYEDGDRWDVPSGGCPEGDRATETPEMLHVWFDEAMPGDRFAADMDPDDLQSLLGIGGRSSTDGACDTTLNPESYWNEAAYFDQRSGPGADTTEAVPAQQEQMDRLVQLTALAAVEAGGEGAAQELVAELATTDPQTYAAWMWWTRATGLVGSDIPASSGHHGDHGGSTGSEGHGAHFGPQPWTRMTEPSSCEQLGEQLAAARAVALENPTVADAERNGWVRSNSYMPGIGAHYLKSDLVDEKIEIDRPEMLLYDGTRPDSPVVGVSYFVLTSRDDGPVPAFAGGNDQFHRHVGVCQGDDAGPVLGVRQMTSSECAAMGGSLRDSNGWMSHAWVVPGCESRWGVFSATNPALDRSEGDGSGVLTSGCSVVEPPSGR